MNKDLLNIFQAKIISPTTSQRALSSRFGMAVGKVNRLLSQLRQADLLTSSSQLTPKGQRFIKNHHPKQATILAAGFGMRMVPLNTEFPKGLLQVHGETLIERLIKQLHAVGVTKITVVVGFLKEHYEFLIDKYGVNLVVNSHYAEFNNLYSLTLVRNQLAASYVLPCDLWFQDNPFSPLEDDSWYLFSSQTGNYPWHVQATSHVIPAKGNGNRMVGLAYLNAESAKMLTTQLEEAIKNRQKLTDYWEDCLVADHHFRLPGTKIKADSYREINSFEELRELDENSNQLQTPALKVIDKALHVKPGNISNIEVLKKGMTNRSFTFICQGNKYIMRIPGVGTNKLIDRHREAVTYQTIKDFPATEAVLYLNPDNGYKLTRFIPGAHPCDPHNWEEVKKAMQLLANFHRQQFQTDFTFNLFKQIDFYNQLRNSPSGYQDHGQVTERVKQLRPFVDANVTNWTLCHIDANPDNFIFDEDDHLRLIDWEYAGMQDADLDVAMFAIYAMYDQKELDHLIDLYKGGTCSQLERSKIYAYVAIGGLLWSNWCEYKQSLGRDFGKYSLAQYRYAKEYSYLVLNYLGEEHANN